jgi:diguanylate cyclase (GGDEF)-like protein
MADNGGLLSKLFLFAGADPQQQELERVAEIERRMLMWVKARWVLIVVLGLYTYFMILSKGDNFVALVKEYFVVPSAAFIVIILFNVWCNFSYRKFSALKGIRYFQIILDILFTLVIIHYTGGSLSWGWVVLPLIITESSIILDERWETWAVAVLCSLLYGIQIILELNRFHPPIRVPFLEFLLEDRFTHDVLLWLRFNFVAIFFAVITSYLMGIIRKEEIKLKQRVVIDSITETYNVNHFYHVLNRFNDCLSHVEGDRLVKKIAKVLRGAVRRSDTKPSYDIDVLCRYGGDKFALILPNTSAEGSLRAAERLLNIIRDQNKTILPEFCADFPDNETLKNFKITASIGVASFPDHAQTINDLVDVVEKNVKTAKSKGKDKAVGTERKT